MNHKKDISLQIEKIKSIFQNSKEFCTEEDNLNLLIQHLENTGPEFRSVAYEGASMALALKDLTKGDSLNHWRAFIKGQGADHERQGHSGLGWAIAQQGRSALPFFEMLSPLMRFCVLDGCGYYDGIFKQRQTIKARKPPETFKGQLLEAYDQGVGRSLWYLFKGEEEKIKETINTFSPERHSSLWRGIGVASVYVGGCDENHLKSLQLSAGEHQTQLALGAILAARSRVQAKAVTPDVELACRVWCNLSVEDAMILSVKAETDITNTNESFGTWLSKMKEELNSKQLMKNIQ